MGLPTALLFNVLVARALGPAGTGGFLIAFGAASALSLASVFGQDEILTRRVAAGEAPLKALGIGAGISVTAFGLLAVLVCVARVTFLPQLSNGMAVALLATVFSVTLLYLVTGVLRGLGHVGLFQAGRSVGPMALGSAAVLVMGVWGAPQALLTYAASVLLTALIMLGYVVWFAAEDAGTGRYTVGNKATLIPNIIAGLSFGLFGLGAVALRWTDVFLMGVWQPRASVGVYGMAARVAALFAVFLNVPGNVAAADIAAAYAERNLKAVGEAAVRMARMTMILGAPTVLLTLIGAGQILAVFGAEFRGGAEILRILLLGQSVNLLTGITTTVLAMTGGESSLRKIQIVALGCSVAVGVIVIPVAGGTGAALMMASVVAGQNLAAWFVIRQRMSLRVDPF